MNSSSPSYIRNLLPWLSGLLLALSWPVSPLAWVIFVALVPLLWFDRHTANSARFFWVVLVNMLTWNALTTWWIWNSTGPGAAGAIIANSLLMVFPWMAFRFTRRRLGNGIGYLSLVLYWVAFEYLHHNWDLSWPWLTLGNVFANHPSWVMWYSATGTTGGSIWILLTNLAIFQWLFYPDAKRKGLVQRLLVADLLVIPLVISYIVAINVKEDPLQKDKVGSNIVVVQPNVEPYTEKFTTDPVTLANELVRLSEGTMDSSTRLIVWPETAIPAQAWEHRMKENAAFAPVYTFLQKHPKVLLVTGIDSYKYYGEDNPGGFSIRQMNDGTYYEAFNSAMGANKDLQPQLYHKRKLVPGVETLPEWLGFMGSLFDDFGGISGTLGRSNHAEVFSAASNPYHAAPIICYESIYSDYVTDYVRRGANVLTIITNDGWWGNTPGYQQHMAMARLRAIENKIWIARSANTGISCFIGPDGAVYDAQPWDVKGTIKKSIPTNYSPTFYGRHGDWISRLLWPLSVLLLLYALLQRFIPSSILARTQKHG